MFNLKDSSYFKFHVESPCCHGADLGYSYWEGYKFFGCKGCGKLLPRAVALFAIKKHTRQMREAIRTFRLLT